MTPTDPSKHFTSFRIIGKKAQKLFEQARKNIIQAKEEEKARAKKDLPPQSPPEEVLTVRIPVGNVVRITFAILAILGGTVLLFEVRGKIILLLLAVFVAVVIDPSVEAMQRYGIPRGVAVLLLYFVAIFAFVFLLISLIPIVAGQLQLIAAQLSEYVNNFLRDPTIAFPLVGEQVNARLTGLTQATLQNLSIEQFTDALEQLGQNLASAAQGSLRVAAVVAGSVLNFFVSFILVLVLAFFMQLEKERIIRWLRGFLSVRYRSYLDRKTEAIHTKIGQWARGQILLMFAIFLLSLLALVVLGMPYALTLAILAGFCEFIPAVGPFIAAIPAVIIALTEGGIVWGLVVAAVYYLIQWSENNLLVPLIMKRAVGLSPIAILIALMMAISFPETIHPVVCVMLAIPITTIITLFLNDWRTMQERAR